ncbi:MAG: LPS export ABC transporter periplasmic protein LptC [Spirochaetes bacterium]|nr:LPS export ABC transporter periplasmic protein LptC [Spirochaetota bacterium]
MKTFMIFLAAFIFTSCSIIFSGGSEKTGKDIKTKNEKKIPTSIIKTFIRTCVEKNGQLLWRLRAREGRIFEREQKVYLTDFLMFFYKNGQHVSTLRARRGIIYQKSRKIISKKSVFVKSSTGRTLQTEELYWDNQKNIMYNEVFNTLTREDGSVLTGTHLWAHKDLKLFKLKYARATIPMSENTNSGWNKRSSTNNASK